MAVWFRRTAQILLTGLTLLGIAACAAVPSPTERRQTVQRLLDSRDWTRLDIQADPFVLAAFLPHNRAEHRIRYDCLTVYIEGDGLAWSTYTRPSTDPTPTTPMALLLAMAQEQGPAVALARPCQYTMATSAGACDVRFWTSHRFAPEVIAATNEALSRLKTLTGVSGLRLVGYSGGGAVAALVAATREDVRELVTVAGNLDPAAWVAFHRLSPLDGSLDPMAVAPALAHLPQHHFIGSRDDVVPRNLAEHFLARQGKTEKTSLHLVAGPNHAEGWAERWPQLLQLLAPCVSPKE